MWSGVGRQISMAWGREVRSYTSNRSAKQLFGGCQIKLAEFVAGAHCLGILYLSTWTVQGCHCSGVKWQTSKTAGTQALCTFGQVLEAYARSWWEQWKWGYRVGVLCFENVCHEPKARTTRWWSCQAEVKHCVRNKTEGIILDHGEPITELEVHGQSRELIEQDRNSSAVRLDVY